MTEIRRRGSRVAFENQWMRLRVDDIEYADGTPGVYSVLEKTDFAVVLPFQEGGFWLVEQYRYPVSRRAWEFPQGTWRHGEGGSAIELAVTELREETGHSAARWRHLGRLYAAYGYSNQAFDVFLATDLSPGDPDREHSEQDMVHQWFPEATVRAMITDGQLVDAHSVAALSLYDNVGRHRRGQAPTV
jgi:8-oxo-dGTP pyrophosphatase MutT (NUDIX family)